MIRACRGEIANLLLVFCLGLPVLCLATPAPERIASLNLCTDSLLFELVPDRRIASITNLSRDPNLSFFHERAANLPVNRGAVEELIDLSPDLVITGENTTQFAEHLLERLGYEILRFPTANSFREYADNLTRLAARIGLERTARRLLDTMWSELATHAAASKGGPRFTALVFQPNAYVPGTATFMDEIIEYTGMQHAADKLGIRFGSFLTLEQLLIAAPDVLILSRFRADAPSLGEQLLNHRALVAGTNRPARFDRRFVNDNLWTCPGTFSVLALAELQVSSRVESARP